MSILKLLDVIEEEFNNVCRSFIPFVYHPLGGVKKMKMVFIFTRMSRKGIFHFKYYQIQA